MQHLLLFLFNLALDLLVVLVVLLSLEPPAKPHQNYEDNQSCIATHVPTTMAITSPTIERVELKIPSWLAVLQDSFSVLKG